MTSPNETSLNSFFELLTSSINDSSWYKLTLSKYKGAEIDLQRLQIKPLSLRNELKLCFVYSYKTRDITKNLSPLDGLSTLKNLLPDAFKSAHFFCHNAETHVEISKKGKLSMKTKKSTLKVNQNSSHNRQKKRYVDINRPFLTALGVTDQHCALIPSMAKKWKQINKFIEIFSQALESSSSLKEQPIQVVDFGSGKGYLTFAIHDYLRHSLNNISTVTGVELRLELANLCNKAAAKLDHSGLNFVCGDVKTHAPKHTDVMIALHACDVATDYAIHYGIRTNAAIIMCAPCCHKQLRPQMKPPNVLAPVYKHGVHMGQQAEMVTDSLRALLLEANGYTTKVFEFVSLEHTNKNKMILAIKKTQPQSNPQTLAQIETIKDFYGISEHCLEVLLNENIDS